MTMQEDHYLLMINYQLSYNMPLPQNRHMPQASMYALLLLQLVCFFNENYRPPMTLFHLCAFSKPFLPS